jgi:hypothetical protein
MKAIYTTALPLTERWNGSKNKLKQGFNQVFTFLTGYEIMFEESRKDLIRIEKAWKF